MIRQPEFLDCIGQRAFYRPLSTAGFAQVLDLVGAAMRWAHEQQLRDMLLNATGLSGLPPLTTFMRYEAIMRWAESAPGLRVAWVVTPGLIDPLKFGMIVARNRGMDGEMFTSEPAALAWLDARAAPDSANP